MVYQILPKMIVSTFMFNLMCTTLQVLKINPLANFGCAFLPKYHMPIVLLFFLNHQIVHEYAHKDNISDVTNTPLHAQVGHDSHFGCNIPNAHFTSSPTTS